MILFVCEYTVYTPSIIVTLNWLYCSCWWRSRLEVFLGSGQIRHFSTLLSIALSHAGIEIHGSNWYHNIVWAEEHVHVWQDGSKSLACAAQEFHNSEMTDNFFNVRLIRLDQAWPSKPIVSVESTYDVHFRKAVVQWSIKMTVAWWGVKLDHFRPKIDWNFTFLLLMNGVTTSRQANLYSSSTPTSACLMVGSAGCTRLG